MKRIAIQSLLMVMVFSTLTVFAERETTDMSSPKAALKSFERVGTDTNLDRATVFYHAITDDQKRVAKALSNVDLELAKLRKLVAAKWNKETGDLVMHAFRDVTSEDIEAAKEVVTGDKAKISGKYFSDTVTLIKVDNGWKISLPDAMAAGAKADDMIQTADDLIQIMQSVTQELSVNKYANPSLMNRAILRRVKEVLGD